MLVIMMLALVSGGKYLEIPGTELRLSSGVSFTKVNQLVNSRDV